METTLLTDYAAALLDAILDKDGSITKPSVRNNHAVVRASGWLKGSERTIFMAVFIYDEKDALRVNVRSNKNGCFHYPPIPKTQITPEKRDRLAKVIIANVTNHIESTK
jgi:hypothetical protein